MYEDRIQNYDQKYTLSHAISFIAMCRLLLSSIFTANYNVGQQFPAVTVSLKYKFLQVFLKQKPKTEI